MTDDINRGRSNDWFDDDYLVPSTRQEVVDPWAVVETPVMPQPANDMVGLHPATPSPTVETAEETPAPQIASDAAPSNPTFNPTLPVDDFWGVDEGWRTGGLSVPESSVEPDIKLPSTFLTANDPWKLEDISFGRVERHLPFKIAQVMNELDPCSRSVRDRTRLVVTEYLSSHEHSRSFDRVRQLARDVGDPDILANALILRTKFEQDETIRLTRWFVRKKLANGRIGPLEVIVTPRSEGVLTYSAAATIARTRVDLPVEEMIDQTWLEEWLDLSRPLRQSGSQQLEWMAFWRYALARTEREASDWSFMDDDPTDIHLDDPNLPVRRFLTLPSEIKHSLRVGVVAKPGAPKVVRFADIKKRAEAQAREEAEEAAIAEAKAEAEAKALAKLQKKALRKARAAGASQSS